MVNAEEILTESSSSTSTTYAELNTETTSNGPVACHYNADGKLYGKRVHLVACGLSLKKWQRLVMNSI